MIEWLARVVGTGMLTGSRYIVGALMILVTLLINIEIVLRFFLNLPLDAVSEIVLLLFPWMALLGAAVAITVIDANVALHLLSGRVSHRGRVVIHILGRIATIAFVLFMIVGGARYTVMTSGELSNVLEIPRSFEVGAFPVAGVLFILFSLRAIGPLVGNEATEEK